MNPEENKDKDNSVSVDDNRGQDIVNKYDSADNSERPSKTKITRMMQSAPSDENQVKTPEQIANKKIKKVGFFTLTAKYWIKKWHWSLVVIILALMTSAAIAVGPWLIQQMTKAIVLEKGGTYIGIKSIPDFTNAEGKMLPFAAPYDHFAELISQLPSLLKGKIPQDDLDKLITSLNGMIPEGHFDWHIYMYIELAMFASIALTQLGSNLIAGFLGKAIEIDLRNESIKKLIVEDMSFYSDKKIGDVLTKVVSDTQIVGDQSQTIPVTFLNAVFTSIGSVIMMFVIDWKIALVSIGLIGLIFLFTGATFGGLRKLMFKVRDVITTINGTVINRISTVQLIKTSGTEDYEKKNFSKLHEEYEDAYKKSTKMQSVLIMFLMVGVASIQAVLVACAAGIYSNDSVKLTELLPSIILAVGVMIGPVMQIVRVVSGIIMASTSSERIAEILYAPKRIDAHLNKGEGIYIDGIKGPIVFDNVTFAYPEKPDKVIIPNFSFKFEEGKSYAFVGETGSGKSTISRLLLRFYDPTYGAVLINGDINLKDIHMPSYLAHVGYVEQEPQILLGDVFENVRYGTEGKTDEEVIEACKKAEIHDIIMSWPAGYKTILGENGFMLSGGQKQRIVIARMFLKDPELLILDEATSALDNIVEKEIQDKLNVLMKGRTTVSIAHRLSTIKNADEVIVLAPGQGVIQRGTFNELKKVPGHFKDLFEAGAMK